MSIFIVRHQVKGGKISKQYAKYYFLKMIIITVIL